MPSNCQRDLLFICIISTENVLFVEDFVSCSLWEGRRRAIAVQYALYRQEGWPAREQLIDPAIVISKEKFLKHETMMLIFPVGYFSWFVKWLVKALYESSNFIAIWGIRRSRLSWSDLMYEAICFLCNFLSELFILTPKWMKKCSFVYLAFFELRIWTAKVSRFKVVDNSAITRRG